MGKNADMNDVVLKVEHLTKHYPIKKGVFSKSDACVHALEDASFEVHRGETFAIVGESLKGTVLIFQTSRLLRSGLMSASLISPCSRARLMDCG